MRGAAFIRRPAARRTLRLLRGREDASAIGAVTDVVRRQGWVANPASGLGEEELTRQADLGRLLTLAEQLPAGSSVADFRRDLEARFGGESEGRGVNLLTYHRAKGLEWEAVFLPRLEEKELPYGKARGPERLAEERRLFYVGITRAKRFLALTWTAGAKPSRFLRELGVVGGAASAPARAEKRRVDARSSRPCAAGAPSARRPTRCPPTSSSTTGRCTRSPPSARRRARS